MTARENCRSSSDDERRRAGTLSSLRFLMRMEMYLNASRRGQTIIHLKDQTSLSVGRIIHISCVDFNFGRRSIGKRLFDSMIVQNEFP